MKAIKIIIVFTLMLQSEISFSQNISILTNKKVIEMAKVGFSEQIIVAKINSSQCAFNLELDSMILLKSNGVSDGIIAAMMNAKQVSLAESNSDNPNEMHNSGIYYYDSIAPFGEKVKQLDENVISQKKASGATIYGIPVSNSSIVVDGAQSHFVIDLNNSPDFYFYFKNDNSNNSLNESGFKSYNATTPNQFSLILFSVNSSSNQRSVQTSSGTGFTESSGISSKYKVQFEYKKMSDGLYKVFFKNPLKAGEYAFIYSGSSGYNNKIFDFSIVVPKNSNGKKTK